MWWIGSQGEFVNEALWEDEDHGNGEVIHLTDDHFDSYRAEHPHLFTMFYAVRAHSAAQRSTAQRSTAHHSTARHGTAQRSAAQRTTLTNQRQAFA